MRINFFDYMNSTAGRQNEGDYPLSHSINGRVYHVLNGKLYSEDYLYGE